MAKAKYTKTFTARITEEQYRKLNLILSIKSMENNGAFVEISELNREIIKRGIQGIIEDHGGPEEVAKKLNEFQIKELKELGMNYELEGYTKKDLEG